MAILGVTHEQHPARCRLFAQWQQFDWPILSDPINVIETMAVPIVVAIDEHGIVRSARLRVETFEKEFLDREFEDDAPPVGQTGGVPDLEMLASQAQSADSFASWRTLGDALVLWEGDDRVNAAIDAYEKAVAIKPRDGNTLFRLGVCHRRRYESTGRQADDFQQAVSYWEQALKIDPNQYIWRRRIQQYGPRLLKPYPFYDWVERATAEVASRGEEPVALQVSLTGAEVARPQRGFAGETAAQQPPDPDGKIHRDRQRLIETSISAVPRRLEPGKVARIHIGFHPQAALLAHWNNEAEPLKLWVEVPDGWQLSSRLLTAPQPTAAESTEPRHIDFEVRAPDGASGPVQITAYALYSVCEGTGGTCLYLRQDVTIEVVVVKR